MAHQIPIADIIEGFRAGFVETFEAVHGIYLDKGTSLFETLDTLSAEEASKPVSAHCATIAAHVAHVQLYLEVLEDAMLRRKREKVDWGEIWRTVSSVTPEAWETSKASLKATYQRIMSEMQDTATWQDVHEISAAFSMVIHTAYHLGEIRQAICHIRHG